MKKTGDIDVVRCRGEEQTRELKASHRLPKAEKNKAIALKKEADVETEKKNSTVGDSRWRVGDERSRCGGCQCGCGCCECCFCCCCCDYEVKRDDLNSAYIVVSDEAN
ncbi:unnamed protein product [Lactuca virosa]|uniref:Uncharacterized protein n=1 Tax=Lactuca virosa TaxID=75947 RepID=A0AAU9PI10_9ASTR|nr:unnamed protein product [Lactuca virosa]